MNRNPLLRFNKRLFLSFFKFYVIGVIDVLKCKPAPTFTLCYDPVMSFCIREEFIGLVSILFENSNKYSELNLFWQNLFIYLIKISHSVKKTRDSVTYHTDGVANHINHVTYQLSIVLHITNRSSHISLI